MFPTVYALLYCEIVRCVFALRFCDVLLMGCCVCVCALKVDLGRRQEVVVYDQSTKDAGQLPKDGFVHILLSKLDGSFHRVSLLTGTDRPERWERVDSALHQKRVTVPKHTPAFCCHSLTFILSLFNFPHGSVLSDCFLFRLNESEALMICVVCWQTFLLCHHTRLLHYLFCTMPLSS